MSGKAVYEHVEVDKMLSRLNVWFLPFRWGINTYRGCEHNCVYCNARYAHEFLGLETGEFAQRIMVKDNAAEALDKQFSQDKWRSELTVNLATVSDPYQVFLKHHNALLLSTKSDLVLQDIDLLAEIAATGFLNVVVSLSTMDEALRKKIEPKASSVKKRVEAIRQLHERGITVGVTAIPLLPHLSDGEEQLEKLISMVAEAGAGYLIPDVLNLRGESRGRVMEFLSREHPELVPEYEKLYTTDDCDKIYSYRRKKD